MNKQSYKVVFDRDETGAWIVEIPGVKGCHTWGRTIEKARENIREALALFIDRDAAKAEFDEEIRPPAGAREVVERARASRIAADRAASEAQEATRVAVDILARDQHLPMRDIADLIGISYQRVHQLASSQPDSIAEKAAVYRTSRRAPRRSQAVGRRKR